MWRLSKNGLFKCRNGVLCLMRLMWAFELTQMRSLCLPWLAMRRSRVFTCLQHQCLPLLAASTLYLTMARNCFVSALTPGIKLTSCSTHPRRHCGHQRHQVCLSAYSPDSGPDPLKLNRSPTLMTVLGFGSLLSETSSRLTFPNLINFRLCRIPNYRRVFAHPAPIFFHRKIANMASLEICSLSAEPVADSPRGFVGTVFDVPIADDDESRIDQSLVQKGLPSRAFLEREEEFRIVQAPFIDLNLSAPLENDKENFSADLVSTETMPPRLAGTGLLCTRSTDEEYIVRWGQDHFEAQFGKFGIDTIWNWPLDSGIRPCGIYLRHCYLAAKAHGEPCLSSFLDETYLVDRQTTIRTYLLEQNPNILELQPPVELLQRYNG
jgi:hypothetical protein